MKLIGSTVSLCPTCYREIPATIEVNSTGPEAGVFLVKKCPNHGLTRAMLERDPAFFLYARSQASEIYTGTFIDVTRKCQLRCVPCFYHLEKTDPLGEYSLPSIVAECRASLLARPQDALPFIFTGGEPTLRDDLVELINEVQKIGPVELVTNGVRLADPEFFTLVLPHLTRTDGVATVHLSIHHKETDKWKEVIDLCRLNRVVLSSALIVVSNREDLRTAMKIAHQIRDAVVSIRIKAESKIWHEQRDNEKIFNSDLIQWLEEDYGKVVIKTYERNFKTVYTPVLCDGLNLLLVKWHEVDNVDLNDINCGPWYRARTGELANFATALMINEGYDKGWLKGRQRDAGPNRGLPTAAHAKASQT